MYEEGTKKYLLMIAPYTKDSGGQFHETYMFERMWLRGQAPVEPFTSLAAAVEARDRLVATMAYRVTIVEIVL